MDKAHILREIKRTAEANSGVPLGRERFVTETGIKQSDWFGIHWAKWGDAVREAGYEPNQLNSAFDEVLLLAKYARFAQELGRLPTEGELRMKRRRDNDFPSSKTFSRLGTKLELVTRVAEYCHSRSDSEKVFQLCEEYIRASDTTGDEVKTTEMASDETTDGYVYLIKMNGHRYYKIGMTNSVGRREYELNLQLPERTELIHVIPTDDPAGIEAYWHNRFKDKNTNGEWFALDAADVAAFKRRKFM